MASTYSNLKIELMETGQSNNQWGNVTNTNLGTALEQAIVGMATLATGDFTTNVATLTLANTNALQDARALVLNVTATLTGAGTINVPAIEKPYVIFNNSVGGYAVTVKVSGQTGVSVPNGKKTVVYNNGTDVGEQINFLSNLSLGAALPVASGGTGLTAAGTAGYVLMSNGTAFVATSLAATATSYTAKQSFPGAATTVGASLQAVLEKANVSATAATGTVAFNINTAVVWYYTTNASANWTVNIRGDGSNSLDSLMATGESMTCAFLVTQGSTAYYNSAVQVDGTTSGVTTKWQGGIAPTSGNTSGIDVYTYTVIKTASATFTVLASQTQFA